MQIKSACIFLKEKNLSICDKNRIVGDIKIAFKSEESLNDSNLEERTRIETPIKRLKDSFNFDSSKSNKVFKRKKSIILKGILKTRSSHDRKLPKNNSLKVTFGSAEFSYWYNNINKINNIQNRILYIIFIS